MSAIISANGVSKRYGAFKALDNLTLTIESGRIVGLIGPNGAGKTTALRCFLGLSTFEGQLRVLGKDPRKDRIDLLQDIAYIADTAVLPQWIGVDQLLDYMHNVHPGFSRERALAFLGGTDIKPAHKVKQLSKGMITQLHLALAISINARLLVLDEPTLGLDILYRKRFYEQLLNDYFDEHRTIVITTHQVEEVEQLLTDLIFIKQGKAVLDAAMDAIAQTYVELVVDANLVQQARALQPISERTVMGGAIMLFENADIERLQTLGKRRIPSVTDLFIAKMA